MKATFAEPKEVDVGSMITDSIRTVGTDGVVPFRDVGKSGPEKDRRQKMLTHAQTNPLF